MQTVHSAQSFGFATGRLRRAAGGLVGLILALSAAACTTDGTPTATAPATGRGPTVAFESIDGPPEPVFQRLVQNLSDEAQVRQVAVVSRAEAAQYRVRAYVATQTQGSRATVSWVWDVYDADQRRVLRLSGEEPASAGGAGTWAVADEQIIRRIANTGMDRLIAYLASPGSGTRPAPAVPERSRGPAVAATAAESLAFLDAGQ